MGPRISVAAVPWTRKDVKRYLDGAITDWRAKRKRARSKVSDARCAAYIDAFQSVRVSLYGEALPEDEDA